MTARSSPASSPAPSTAPINFEIGLASPLNVAAGLEAREDTYTIKAGDPAPTTRKEPQSFPGFAPASAGYHSRKNYAGYVDFAVRRSRPCNSTSPAAPSTSLDFGDTQIGKITARYDFNPQWALRGTISTGFRAPTLEEEYYTAVNVSPTRPRCQLPADSAAAKILGLPNLKPETSTELQRRHCRPSA